MPLQGWYLISEIGRKKSCFRCRIPEVVKEKSERCKKSAKKDLGKLKSAILSPKKEKRLMKAEKRFKLSDR
tara:strand:+ start:92 stop:304 length:213 start_codon:yes stop_codon:yes gene_type:complete